MQVLWEACCVPSPTSYLAANPVVSSPVIHLPHVSLVTTAGVLGGLPDITHYIYT
jgi:hypothetical protein